ncbi:hypothetical protein HNP12_002424 [Aeromonas hydrophila]|uniref:hypothetical protein n=1 Tax=Aeromonas hydrophila TaxID=644 RepID=UPI002168EB52|nr:hypothetical protein [Aeromonas hydrophila]MCS3768350.1 hypothetical protein [Aeromonas hydrophila]
MDRLLVTKSGIGCEEGDHWPVLSQNKQHWIVLICGAEKKVIKSTGKFAGAPKNGPEFVLRVPENDVTPAKNNVTVTETQLDLIPRKRPRGRPATGNALSPAEKQARYRARKAQKTVTVTFNRDAVDALENHIRALVGGHDAPLSLDMLQSMLDSIRSATQTQLAQEAV